MRHRRANATGDAYFFTVTSLLTPSTGSCRQPKQHPRANLQLSGILMRLDMIANDFRIPFRCFLRLYTRLSLDHRRIDQQWANHLPTQDFLR